MLSSNITFYHNQKWNLLQTISPFDQKHVSIAQMRLCKKATVYGPNLKYASLTWLLVEEAMGADISYFVGIPNLGRWG